MEKYFFNTFCQHRKHDPENGKWHRYRVIAIVQPGEVSPEDIELRSSSDKFRHTDSESLHTLVTQGYGDLKADPPLAVPHVAYENTHTELRDSRWAYCLRPLDEFMDGRFTQVDEP